LQKYEANYIKEKHSIHHFGTIYKVRSVQKQVWSANLIVAGLDHQHSWFMVLYTNIESCQAAAMLLSGIEEDRLVHGNSHW
jgi:hypothetical protein